MTMQILFIHGGGEGAHEADSKLAASLRHALGADYRVINPAMPNENAPEYDAWKDLITKEVAALDGPVILAGHSLGGSLLIKVLAEEQLDKPIAGLFLIAAPYWGAPDWEVDEYALRDGFASCLPAQTPIFLYHSRGDEWVPFEHMALYAAKLPHATMHEFEGRGHQFNDDLTEVAADIARL